MRRLAAAFAGLETTQSRRTMVQVLAELCREAAPDDLAVVLYLTQGRLRPAYEAVEIGMGEQTMAQMLADAYQAPLERVAQVSASLGDLGLAAEQLNPREQSDLPVSAVYDILLEVARTAGRGSSERRVRRLAELFALLGRLEARYVARICLGRLRLGVGDATLLDGLAAAFATVRKPLERAYNLHPDLGWLGETLATVGIEALARAHPEPGVPILPALAERLPSAEAILARLGPCLVEPKYDGLRVQLHRDGDRVWLFSRRLENLTEMLPEVVRAVPEQIALQRCIVEGEALVYNPETEEFLPFQITAQRRRKYRVEEMTVRYPLRLFLFDLMLEGMDDYTPRPLHERREALLAFVRRAPDRPIDVTRDAVVDDAEALDRFFDECISEGLEGILAKRLDSPYHAGARNFNWVKLKRAARGALTDTVDAVIVGYLLGRGARARLGIGSLLVAVYDADNDKFETIAKVGSGLTEEKWVRLRGLLDEVRSPQRPARVVSRLVPDMWVVPTYVVEVQADEITRSAMHTAGQAPGESGYALRFPRVIDWIREDRRPEDATTVDEILRMHAQQRRQRQE
jgi:DNA ligase 1